ncbi:MAG: GFA family protein [Proteobacteria bacterium]|nr:GFA family protein [Pseudomonadota bacterium]
MSERTASCSCGALSITCAGDPVRVSVCHCLACQQRTGSAFAAQARWPLERARLSGDFTEWTRVGDIGGRATFRFCPRCGSTVAYVVDAMPGVIAVPLGAFADPAFPPPRFSVYEARQHAWVAVLGDDVEHVD